MLVGGDINLESLRFQTVQGEGDTKGRKVVLSDRGGKWVRWRGASNRCRTEKGSGRGIGQYQFFPGARAGKSEEKKGKRKRGMKKRARGERDAGEKRTFSLGGKGEEKAASRALELREQEGSLLRRFIF